MTDVENIVENIIVGECFGTSDHQIIRWDLTISDIKQTSKDVRYNYFKADYDNIRKCIINKNLMSKITGLNVENSWKVFIQSMQEVIEGQVPIQKNWNNKNPWMTRLIIKKQRAKCKVWKKYRDLNCTIRRDNSNTEKIKELKEKYKKKRNEVK